MVSFLRFLSVYVCLVGYAGLAVEHRHGPGWPWYATILWGMAVHHLLTTRRER